MTETQPIGPISSLEDLQHLNKAFEIDRPLLGARNNPHLNYIRQGNGYLIKELQPGGMDISVPRKLLVDEIEEFNGAADRGFLSRPENREDNRQQEVSDMVLFAITLFAGLGKDADGRPLSPNTARVDDLLTDTLADLAIKKVSLQRLPGHVDRFTARNEAKFEELKGEINIQGRRLFDVSTADLNVREVLLVKDILERILSLSFAVFHLMEVHPVRQVGEKIARNYVKYPAHMLSIQHVPQLDADLPLELRRELLEAAYRKQANKIRDLWDGPVPVDANGQRLRDANGQLLPRPGFGTDDFYSEGLYMFETETQDDSVVVGKPRVLFDGSNHR